MKTETIKLIKGIMSPYQNKKKDMRAVRSIIWQIHENCPEVKWATFKPYFSVHPEENNQDLSIIVEDRSGEKKMFSVTTRLGVGCKSI